MVCTHLLASPFGISILWPVPEKNHQICFLLVCLQLFSHILKREFQENDTKHLSRKFTEWVYGPVTCSLYDLASVDSYQKNSALEILVYGSDVPVSPISISISPQSVSCVSELSCLPSEPPRDAPDGPSGPAAGVKVEEVCGSYVLFELPVLPCVPDCLHSCSLQQE